MMKKCGITLLVFLFVIQAQAASILIPMDLTQKDHLKSYGIAYWVIAKGVEVQWLLNYRNGSFMFRYDKSFETECKLRGVTFEVIPDAQATMILSEIANPEVNMEAVKLEKAPKIAVYTPKGKQPWDDAVTR
jgi:hypothetical protein